MTHTMGYDRGLLFSREIPEVGEYNLLDYVLILTLFINPVNILFIQMLVPILFQL